MQLHVLGCGPIVQGNNIRNCSGYLIDRQLLFDCGPGIWQALNRTGLPAWHLNVIIISHFHIDHVADIAPFLMARYLNEDLVKQPLQLIGPDGIKDWYDRVQVFCGAWLDKISVDIVTARASQKIIGYELYSAHTGHSDKSLCYRLENSTGSSFFYSGDSDRQAALTRLAQDCDLAVIEASNTDETKVEGHLTPGLAAQIAAEANVNKLVLTHMYPEVEHEFALTSAREYFSGEIEIARDGMLIDIADN